MNKAEAVKLAERMNTAFPSDRPVRAEQVNPYAGEDAGWAARVDRPDGTTVDVIGSSASGYNITGRALGWQSYERMVEALTADLDALTVPKAEELSPTDDSDLAARLTAVAALIAEAGAELGAIRDELVLRSKR